MAKVSADSNPVADVPEAEKKARDEDNLTMSAIEQVAFVDTDQFNSTMCCFICVNIITIGMETEFGESATMFNAINQGFLLAYIMELILRLLTHGLKALRDGFTVIDLIVVSVAFLERIMASGGLARSLPSFRTLRYIRLFRKSRFFKHSLALQAIAMLCRRMFKTLVWVMLVLFIILWTLAVFAHVVVAYSPEWNETMDPNREFPPFVPLDIQQYFGSVGKSFITLLQVVTLSQWSNHIARRVVKVFPLSMAFFIGFIWVCSYALMVALLSNLVQDSMDATQQNSAAMKQKEKEDRTKVGMRVRDILADVDADGSGELDESELAWALKVTNLADILLEMGVPVTDAHGLVCLLDYNGNGLVSYDELVGGIVKMDDHVTTRDLTMLGFWVKNLLNRTNHLEERLGKLCDQMSFIRNRLNGTFGSLNHMIRTAKDTQMRQRAIRLMKTSGPALPPSLERKQIETRMVPKTEPSKMLEGFAGRWLGEVPKPKRAGSPGLEDNRSISLFRNTMQPAPPRLKVGRHQAQQAEVRWADRYAIGMDFRASPENPNLKALKRELR